MPSAPATDQDATAALTDAIVLMGITLARLEAGAQFQAEAILGSLWRDLMQMVAQHDPLGADTIAQQLARMKRVTAGALPRIRDAFSELADDHQQVREAVAAWAVDGLVEAMQPAFPRLVRQPSDATFTRLATSGLILGATATDWWGRQAATTHQRLSDTLRQAVLQERTSLMLQGDLAGVRDAMVRAADSLIQTSLAAVSQEAQAELYEVNDSQIGSLVWMTTLDTRACLRCIALSGLRWTMHRAPLGHAIPWPGEPPLHFGCRCGFAPLIEGAIAPRAQSFDAWLRTQPVAEQRAILGSGRFQLWQAGRLRLRQLVDQRHRPLTLEALRRESAA